ncbi:MAG: hypothetical protein Q8L60_06585 [Gammaproteobacteria bacterium]|nr:hypothetical protein [Gammaproteobacteria bacterium]MDP2140283.1 hypothetical protein [Gammaproteobacteria bacterium]MDP2346199.1 hypothetical protein [Gammaproteobacteria bacterium]
MLTTLLNNYVLIAFRNLSSHKLFSIINVSGLAIGIRIDGNCRGDSR